MNKKHRKALADIFTNPVPTDIPWTDIFKLLIALTATITQGKDSSVRVVLNRSKGRFSSTSSGARN